MSSVFKAIGKFVKQIFNPKIPKMPQISMPDPGSAAAQLAARRKVDARRGSGRESTIMSGGNAYTGLNLGGTS